MWGWERLSEGGAGRGRAPEPSGCLSRPSMVIPSLFTEIRMSKPLEAEKQSLDSPSEHTGECRRAEAGERADGAGNRL